MIKERTWENITLSDLDMLIAAIGLGEKWSVVINDNIQDSYEELEQSIDYYDMVAKYGTRKVVLMDTRHHEIFLRAEEEN